MLLFQLSFYYSHFKLYSISMLARFINPVGEEYNLRFLYRLSSGTNIWWRDSGIFCFSIHNRKLKKTIWKCKWMNTLWVRSPWSAAIIKVQPSWLYWTIQCTCRFLPLGALQWDRFALPRIGVANMTCKLIQCFYSEFSNSVLKCPLKWTSKPNI